MLVYLKDTTEKKNIFLIQFSLWHESLWGFVYVPIMGFFAIIFFIDKGEEDKVVKRERETRGAILGWGVLSIDDRSCQWYTRLSL